MGQDYSHHRIRSNTPNRNVPDHPHDRTSPKTFGKPVATWLRPDEFAEWDGFVGRHPHAVVFHLSVWKRIIETSFPHMSGRIVVLRDPDQGGILAGMPVYRVRSWLLGNRLVSIPFASLCDPLLGDDSHWQLLQSALQQDENANGKTPLECRTWKLTKSLPISHQCLTESALHHWLDISPGPEAIYPRFSRTAIRRVISKSTQRGTRVNHATSEADVAEFYRLLVQSRRRIGLPTIPYVFFRSCWEFLPPRNRSFVLAIRDDRPVAGIFSLCQGANFLMEQSGEGDETCGTGAIQQLIWDEIKLAHSWGCSLVSFGRTAVENTSLASYKLHWGTVQEELVTYWPGSPPVQRNAVAGSSPSRRMIQWLSSHSPHGLYLAMSRFCYKHWG